LARASVIGLKRGRPPTGRGTNTTYEAKPYRKLYGVIEVDDEDPIIGALVEVFTHPEDTPQGPYEAAGKSKQRRVAACRTGPDGKFWFRNLPPGKYEVRSSNEGQPSYVVATPVFDVTSLIVDIDPKKGQRGGVRVWMHPAT
jgi:hypothetical protein